MEATEIEIALCLWCDEPLEQRVGRVAGHHAECGARAILGSVGHMLKLCSCHGGSYDDPPELTKHQAAQLAADLAVMAQAPEIGRQFSQALTEQIKAGRPLFDDPAIAHSYRCFKAGKRAAALGAESQGCLHAQYVRLSSLAEGRKKLTSEDLSQLEAELDRLEAKERAAALN